LASAGYRAIVPYLRGYGTTRFLSSGTFRNGQQAAVALDIINLMDALKIKNAVIGGFDWGSRTAAIMAALWPERCKALVAVSGYLITDVKAQQQRLPPKAELGWWYQYYFATERGRLGYSENRNDFNKLIWKTVSPKWDFDDATFDRTAASFANPDHVAIVIHNYRWRLGLAKGDQKYDDLENRRRSRRNMLGDADKRLIGLGLELPPPTTPFGAYVEAVQTGNLLFLSGTLPTFGHEAKYRGRLGAELDAEQGRAATRLAALNALAIAKEHLGSLSRITRVVRLGVMLATSGDFFDQPRVADAASELFRTVFGADKSSVRLVYGVASLPLGMPVELEVIFEVA
jgi:pimeloyl-ACP methyl ester carboxylesterase